MCHASSTVATVPFSGEPFTPLPARQWQGETVVVVGPFSSKKWANYFADVVLEKDPTGATACYIFHRMDEWFVDICKQTDEAPVTVPTPTSAGPDAPDKDKEVNTLCPVCSSNMTFAGQRYTSRWHGRVVRFLSARCKRTFKRCRSSEEITWEPRTFD